MKTRQIIQREDQNHYEIENEEEFNFYITILQQICKNNNIHFCCHHSNNLVVEHTHDAPTYDFDAIPMKDVRNFIIEADLAKGKPYQSFRDFVYGENEFVPTYYQIWHDDQFEIEQRQKYKEYKKEYEKNPIRKWLCFHPDYQDNNFDTNEKVADQISEKIRNFIITKSICEDKPVYQSILKLTIKQLIKVVCDYKKSYLFIINSDSCEEYDENIEIDEFTKKLGADIFSFINIIDSDVISDVDFRRYKKKTKMWDKKIKCKKCKKILSKKNCYGYHKVDLCVSCDKKKKTK